MLDEMGCLIGELILGAIHDPFLMNSFNLSIMDLMVKAMSKSCSTIGFMYVNQIRRKCLFMFKYLKPNKGNP
jgi:hypothetical protein